MHLAYISGIICTRIAFTNKSVIEKEMTWWKLLENFRKSLLSIHIRQQSYDVNTHTRTNTSQQQQQQQQVGSNQSIGKWINNTNSGNKSSMAKSNGGFISEIVIYADAPERKKKTIVDIPAGNDGVAVRWMAKVIIKTLHRIRTDWQWHTQM